MHYFTITRVGLARLKMLVRWHLNPNVESQHRYESKYFHEKDLNNSYFVLFLLNKILYFHSQVKKFQNYIYFICNCVNSVNRDDMYSVL
jgi:hypothetical protein